MPTQATARPVNVLSLDGGGIRGLILSLFLEAIETRTGKPISALFDIIAGTSTGGILALALSKPKEPGSQEPAFKASELVKLYDENGDKIFFRSISRMIETLGGLIEEKYSAQGLEGLLQRYFGETRLKEALCDVLITSYDIENRRPFYFKSSLARILPDYDHHMKDVARATSAAPTYFEPAKIPAENNQAGYWALVDGGVFANNPGLLAYTEAIRGRAPKNICLVSIGTGQMTSPLSYEAAKGWGAAQWVRPIIDVVFDGVSDSVDEVLARLLTYDNDYYRFQVDLKGVDEAMDNVEQDNLAALKKLAGQVIYPNRDEAGKPVLNEKLSEACDRLLINKFYPLNAKAVGQACGLPFQKVVTLIKNLQLDLDHSLCFTRTYFVNKKKSGQKVEKQESWYAPQMVDKVKAAC
ncbi:MAG: patatin-like phospholipase family protein [Lewinellaceae bacterium]|nr:patatin-like phospholipase family protein [Lewinellaceae bacterium]